MNDEDYESKTSVVSGYIVREYCEVPSNFRCEGDIDGFLKKHNIIGLFGIDTRRLTRIIRETGVMNGMITTSEPTDEFKAQALERIRAYVVGPVVPKVSVKQPEKFSAENGKYKVALMDYGYKFNIRRELVKRGCDVTVFPYDTSAEEILKFAPDGIMLSNGPGIHKYAEGAYPSQDTYVWHLPRSSALSACKRGYHCQTEIRSQRRKSACNRCYC